MNASLKVSSIRLNYLSLAFKSHKKFIEKEVSVIVNKINAIKKIGSSKGGAVVIESIDALIAKLN